jgi:hypothetical protein
VKLRNSLVLVLAALSFVGCGSKYFIQKDAYSGVKKVALVQYAINPHFLLGTASSDDARIGTAEKAWETFGKEMANQYQVMPFSEMVANAAYGSAGGKPAVEGYYSAKGAQYFSPDTDTLEAGTIPADTAKKLCETLGVDAVAVAYESWGMESYALGFKAHSRNGYVINLFDKNGTRVWGDVVWGTSEEGFATPGGVIATDVPNYLLNNTQAMTVALKEANDHIAGK